MKINGMIVVAMAVAAGLRAGPTDGQRPTLTAYVTDERADRQQALHQAEDLASRIFAAAGLDLKWHCGAPARTPAPGDLTFIVTVVDTTPGDYKRGAMAFAMAFEGIHLTIFYDRVRNFGSQNTNRLLAHVIVHELTHLLQGIDRHSETGIMKAGYSRSDAFQMLRHDLPFTEEDLMLIELGIAHRMHRPTLVAAAGSTAAGNREGR